MKKLIGLVTLLLAFQFVSADEWIGISSDKPADGTIALDASTPSDITLSFSLEGFFKTEVETSRGTAWLISAGNGARMLQESAPDLLQFTGSVIIPGEAKMDAEVVSARYTDIENVLIAPSKGNLSRQVDPSTIPYEFGNYYDRDGFYPGNRISLGSPYIIRDFRGQAVSFRPFQYNPVTKVLRVYYEITVRIFENGESDINSLSSQDPTFIDSRFKEIYQRHFLNFAQQYRYTPVEENGNMIIISYGDFIDEVQPLADWKNQKGIPCSVVDVAEIGGASDIKQFITNAFNINGLTFVLLVGDAAQVPSSSISGDDSDNDYTYVEGNDHYPDLFIGRFSAENESQVTTMVNRTLTYETNPVSDTAWYTKAIGIASDQGPGDDNEYDYEHIRNISNNKLIPFTYNYAYELFDGSQGGEDDPGNPTPSQVATAVNAGATIINYTGHGSTYSWGTSGFSNSDVNNLTNTDKWPFIISVACVNGNFVNNTCFAEAWTRANDSGEPTGALATLMSTVNQSWDPPMAGQDAMNDILTEAFENNIKRTFAGITMNGCMDMNDEYGSSGTGETDYWTIFGDPSVVIRTAIPEEMTVSYPDTLSVGSTSLTVSCDAEGGLAVLSLDNTILGTAYVEDGEAIIEFSGVEEACTADVVVTAFNYRPYIGTLEITGAVGPYVTFASNTIDDGEGNGDGLADYGETLNLTVALTNIGTVDADSVTAYLESTSEYVTVTSDSAYYGLVATGDTVSVNNGFSVEIANNVPDGEQVSFTLYVLGVEGRELWESGFSVTAHAPVLSFLEYSVDDTSGNANGRIDPGETVDMIVTVANEGSSPAFNVAGELTTASAYLNLYDAQQLLGDVTPGQEIQVVYSLSADSDTPPGTEALFTLDLSADLDISTESEFTALLGQIPVLIINFSGNSSAGDSLTSCLGMLGVNAEMSYSIPEKPEMYQSVFILLGFYPDTYVLTPEEGDVFAGYLSQGGNVYMEGGDTWAFDDQTSFHEMFHINGVIDGFDDLNTIHGQAEGFLAGYVMDYAGPNSYIDRIEAKDGAILLATNESPYYGTAVAFQNETYHTIGSSMSFAGLVDNESYSKTGIMAGILNFFNIGFNWVGIEERNPTEIISNAYPNPFTDKLAIEFSIEQKRHVKIEVFDLTGRKVGNVLDSDMAKGNHKVVWDSGQGNGPRLMPGIYFLRIDTGDNTLTRKVVME